MASDADWATHYSDDRLILTDSGSVRIVLEVKVSIPRGPEIRETARSIFKDDIAALQAASRGVIFQPAHEGQLICATTQQGRRITIEFSEPATKKTGKKWQLVARRKMQRSLDRLLAHVDSDDFK